jgi:predicted dehydrogenase
MKASTYTPRLPMRAAVVGSGAISKEHLTFLAGRSQLAGPVADRVRLVGVCDLSPAAASYGATQFGAEKSYTDLATMLDEQDLDIVHVLTPPSTHVALATTCLEAGAHVICEKPITANVSDLEALLATAARCQRSIMESHNYRFNDGFLALEQALSGGRLGRLRGVDIRIALPVTDPSGRFGDPNLPSPIHQMPAGVIHDFTTHFSYLLLRLARDVKFNRIAAAWSNHHGAEFFRFDDLDALLIGDGPDGAVHARLRFDAASAPDTFSIRVQGSEGWSETDLFQPYERTVRARPGGPQLSPIVNHVANGLGLVRDGVTNFGKKLLQHTPYQGLHRMLDETYGAIATGRPLPVTSEDMLQASQLVDRLLDPEAAL